MMKIIQVHCGYRGKAHACNPEGKRFRFKHVLFEQSLLFSITRDGDKCANAKFAHTRRPISPRTLPPIRGWIVSPASDRVLPVPSRYRGIC